MRSIFTVFIGLLFLQVRAQSLYFPPNSGDWEAVDPGSLGWCTDRVPPLYDYLEATNSKGFVVLKNGKIVLEKYFGTFTRDSSWYWASAGKSLTAFVIGVAQQKGLLSIEDRVSKYLGAGWTSCTQEQEDRILIRHLLTMTSGLDDGVGDQFCNRPECLLYKADAGTRWAYHTGVYSLLPDIIEKITGQNINVFLALNIANPAGMKGLWTSSSYGELYFTNIRSMARYGLLILNRGSWAGNDLLKDPVYYNAMVNTSQPLNQSYGYLWWLNGKGSFKLPGLQLDFPGSLIPAAPQDMFAALGKNGQILCVIPSQNLVLVRMGESPDGSGDLVTPAYLRTVFEYFNEVACMTNAVDDIMTNVIQTGPNPVRDLLRWRWPENGQDRGWVEIFDDRGVLVRRVRWTRDEVETGDLQPSSYLLVLKDNKGRIVYRDRFAKI